MIPKKQKNERKKQWKKHGSKNNCASLDKLIIVKIEKNIILKLYFFH
jgi:hypothetical protein